MALKEKNLSEPWNRGGDFVIRATLLVMALLPTNGLDGQERRTASAEDAVLPLSRLSGPVQLDGRSDERAWAGIQPLPLTMVTPSYGAEVSERTEILLAYDEDYLYVAGRLFDSDPAGLRVNSLYRDRYSDDDYFGIVVDPFGDNDIGLWFWTTPAGIRGDYLITADGEGDTNEDWNTHWDVAALEDARGWFAEMRIPFSSLGFESVDGEVRMGVSAHRYIARKNELHVFPDIPPELEFVRPSLTRSVSVQGVTTRRPAYVTPYVLGGIGQAAALTAAADRYRVETGSEAEIGGDLRYSLTSNLTLDLTVNTDFAQVEADDQRVNLTRFSLFFPEQRQFFQERSGVFDFSTGGDTRLFYSRRIGIEPAGQPVRILAGGRVVGRIGPWDVGALDMQTERSPLLPAENFGVVRVRRRVLNPFSTAGAMLTTRVGDDGSYNVAYGLDGTIRMSGDDYLFVRVAQSADQTVLADRGFRFVDASAVRVLIRRLRDRGVTYFLEARRFGEDYAPATGFVARENFTDLSYGIAYILYPDAGASVRRVDPFQLAGEVALRNEDGSVESAATEYNFDLEWRSGAEVSLDLELYYEDLRDSLDFPKATFVPAGSYWYPGMVIGYELPPGRAFRAELDAGLQRFFDGWRASLELAPVWNVSRHAEIAAEYEANVVRFPERRQGFDAHIVRLRLRTALDTRFSVNGFMQWSNTAEFVGANVRIRYNFREGRDLWLVYDEGLNLDRDRVVPSLPLTDSRTILVKYTHALTL